MPSYEIGDDGVVIDTSTGAKVDTKAHGAPANQVHVEAPRAATPQASKAIKEATGQVKTAQAGTFNVVKAARSRVRFLKSEIKKLKVLEKELAQLTRLLAAAERPVAAVVPIKSTKK